MHEPLITPVEKWLHHGGVIALFAAAALRSGLGFLLTRQLWLLDSQLFTLCLLLAVLYSGGSLLPRASGQYFSLLAGAATWLTALSLLPRYGWPTGRWPAWLLLAAAVVLLAAVVLRLVKRALWLRQMRGHGFEWILDWAVARPLAARTTARGVLRSLGYAAPD